MFKPEGGDDQVEDCAVVVGSYEGGYRGAEGDCGLACADWDHVLDAEVVGVVESAVFWAFLAVGFVISVG